MSLEYIVYIQTGRFLLKSFLTILIFSFIANRVDAQMVDTLWTHAYNGPACDEDYVVDLEIDNQNNIYTIGYQYPASMNVIKYSPAGSIVWIGKYFGAATASTIDSNYLYITGHTGGSFGGPSVNQITQKIDLITKDTLWTRIFAGPLDNDQAMDICVDLSGNVFVTGYSESVGSGLDIFTIKYNQDGDTIWTARYNNPGQIDTGEKIAIDTFGNVIIAGNVGNFTTKSCILKYDANGNLLWDKIYSPGTFTNEIKALTIDINNDILAAGNNDENNFDYLILKYYANGDSAWVATYNSFQPVDLANTILTDLKNNVYVTGTNGTVKYDSSGTLLWVCNGNKPAICLEDTSFIYISGAGTMKLSSDGDTIWTLPFTDGFHDTGSPVQLKLDSDKNLVKAGNTFITTCASTNDYMTVKYYQDFCCTDIRGNIDNDPLDVIDISDLVYLVDFMFTGGLEPTCLEEANVDGDSEKLIDISDLVALVDYMFTNGQAPAICPY